MREWFWAWLLAAALMGIVAAATRDRFVAPWAVGCAAAAGLEAFAVNPAWEWVAFFGVSSAIFIALNRVPRYAGRHAKGRGAR